MNPEIRALFPGAEEQVYVNVSARGLVPTTVRDAVTDYLDDCVRGTSDKDRLREEIDETRASFARLIGADAEEIAITKNVSEGLNLFAASLPWEAGDNIVVCPELEHPNNIYLWYNLEKLRGAQVRAIPSDGERMPVRAMADAMDERTRVVTFPTVSFAPGLKTDVEPLVRAAKRVGALTLADGAQSVGALATDVHDMDVDALAVSTQKNLLSLYGFGFLYIKRAVADTLTPIHVARYGVDLGDAHETAYTAGELVYQPGARRFDLGNYNYLGMTAVRTTLALLHEIGVPAVEAHVTRLAARLVNGFAELGLPVVQGTPEAPLAHIVSVGTVGGGRHYSADDPEMNDLHRLLSERGIHHAIRSGVLRLSMAVYNDDADVDRILEVASAWAQERALV